MSHEPDDRSHSRENMLAVALVVLAGGIMLFFLYMVSLGIVGNVLAGACILVMVMSVHYLIWGKAMSQEVAAEREAMLRKEAAELREKTPSADAIQDLSRVQGIQKK